MFHAILYGIVALVDTSTSRMIQFRCCCYLRLQKVQCTHPLTDSSLFQSILRCDALHCDLFAAVYWIYTKMKFYADGRRNILQNQENDQDVKSFWNICTTKGGTSRILAILAWRRTYWGIVYSKITRAWGSGSDWLRPRADGGILLGSYFGHLAYDMAATLQCTIRAHSDRIIVSYSTISDLLYVEIEMWILPDI